MAKRKDWLSLIRRQARKLARERCDYVGVFINAHVEGDEPEPLVIHPAHPKEQNWPN